MTAADAPNALVEHFFRHESGRLAAVLSKRFGVQHLEAIEDAVQHALERALGTWARRGVPDEPAAWLTRVASNYLLDLLRRGRTAQGHAEAQSDAEPLTRLDEEGDDILVLLFACADERLAPRTRLVLCLKLLCGFSTTEIARSLLVTPANVQKNLERGRRILQESWHREDRSVLTDAQERERLETVQLVLYLQFNEGYSLGPEGDGLRVELCHEAIRLTQMLATHSVGSAPSTWALLALMHFHASRLPARLSESGAFIPLEKQNRSLWDKGQLACAFQSLRLATQEESFSRFHGEAAIQVEHALSPDFSSTRWQEIAELYAALEAMQPSPVYAINRAIAVAEASGPEDALALLDEYDVPQWFRTHHLYHATLGELNRRASRFTEAKKHLLAACRTAPSSAERTLFEERLELCTQSEE